MQLAENDRLALLRVADWLRNYTRALRRPNSHLMVKKHRGDPVRRGIYISITEKVLFLFGQRLDRTSATLTSVAIGKHVGTRPARSALSRDKQTRKRNARKQTKRK
jgi:hypothetical protein